MRRGVLKGISLSGLSFALQRLMGLSTQELDYRRFFSQQSREDA